ncbi:MAG: N-acetyltransferase [Acidobacteriaceae bacterium]|nr:N-acetyltransferase [Acidobacteriaceae bacterium]MBV9304672.1 N-acetyltransferase [Acidobacteriaceae bacterium]MBV9676470.1 N-acetyltransferase [Acidobacteriaceae bacterium]MBV9938987.1 N-acetyltransferase [Acidobacteriaceae bacterium]
MEACSIAVREVADRDVPTVQKIYTFYVLNRLVTFEELPPTKDELLARQRRILDTGLPFLVATIDDCVVGYAYASPYRSRPAYRYTVEDSVYVLDSLHSKGIGAALLSALIERCEKGNWRQMIAIIGDSANVGSIALHKRFGFEHIGTLKAVGFKLGQWVDTVLMQRSLGHGAQTLPLK